MLKLFIRISFTILLFYYLFFHIIDPENFFNVITSSNILYSFLALITLIISVMITAFRWKLILNIKNIDISYFILLKEYFIGHFFNNFLPTSIGGDISRVIGVSKFLDIDKGIIFSSVIIERIIGFIALLLIGNIGIFYLKVGTEDSSIISIFSLLFLIFVLSAFVILISKRSNKFFSSIIDNLLPNWGIKEKILSFLTSFKDYSSDRVKLINILFLSLFFRVIEGLFVYFIVLSLNITNLSYIYTLVLNSVVSTIKLIPVSLNGLGLSEMSWVYLTKSASINPESATAISLSVMFISVTMSLIGGIFYLVRKK